MPNNRPDVADPGFVSSQRLNRLLSSQTYAFCLAKKLYGIISLHGGIDSPVYNSNIIPPDQRWVRSYYVSQGKNPSIQQNSKAVCRDLRNLRKKFFFKDSKTILLQLTCYANI